MLIHARTVGPVARAGQPWFDTRKRARDRTSYRLPGHREKLIRFSRVQPEVYPRPCRGSEDGQQDDAAQRAAVQAGIRPDTYQLVPPQRPLRLPMVNLLSADVTGLGKTIEAGLNALEVLIQERGRG